MHMHFEACIAENLEYIEVEGESAHDKNVFDNYSFIY